MRAELETLVVRLEGLSVGLDERLVARNLELSAQLERLSARFDEFAETASDDGSSDRSRGFDRELSAQLERLSARFDEVAGAGVGEELQARLAAVDDAQRRGEEVLGGVASGLAALGERRRRGSGRSWRRRSGCRMFLGR